MLGGVAPILIFNFKTLSPEALEKLKGLPIPEGFSSPLSTIPLPPIPIYLDERLTGIYIDSESKSLDIETQNITLIDGKPPLSFQKGIDNKVSVSMFASRDSIGLTVLLSMIDKIFDKVTSKEYSITYLNGAVTVFGGSLHEFTVDQNSNTSLYSINMQISRSSSEGTKPKKDEGVVVNKVTGAIPL